MEVSEQDGYILDHEPDQREAGFWKNNPLAEHNEDVMIKVFLVPRMGSGRSGSRSQRWSYVNGRIIGATRTATNVRYVGSSVNRV